MLLPLLLSTLAAAPTTPAAPPKHVYVGVYLHDVSDFDLKGGRFKADLRVWLKWLGSETPPPLEFENGELEVKDELSRESEGQWRSIQWRVQGTFRGDFPVHDFPFDAQELPVRFSLPRSEGELVPDLGASSMSPKFSITGWLFAPAFRASSSARDFGSDLGSVEHEGERATVQSVAFSVEMRRPIRPYLLKFLLPLAMILAMAVLALCLPVTSLGERTGMGVTALLSCIAFHFTQSDTLPNVSYLVAADKLFLGAYVLIGTSLVFTVLGYNLRERARRVTVWFDRLGYSVIPVLAVVGVASALGEPEPPLAPPPAFTRPAPLASSRPSFRIGTVANGRRVQGLGQLTRRGLTVRQADGTRVAGLAEAAPTMTNGLVRLLPDGGMVVRWRLRDGALWSDGVPMSADDLEATFRATADADVREVRRVDERTVEVEYDNRDGERLAGGTLYPAHFVRQQLADGGTSKANDALAEAGAPASGPFRLVQLEDGAKATLEPNPFFVGQRPAFTQVELVTYESSEALAEAMVRGEVDVLQNPSPSVLFILRSQQDLVELSQPGESLVFLQPDVRQPPLSEPAFRHALLQALDRDAMVRQLAPQKVKRADGLRATDAPVLRVEFDRAAAKARFKGAGPLVLYSGQHHSHGPSAAELVAEQLTAAGLAVRVEEVDEPMQLANRREHGGLVVLSRDSSQLHRFFNLPTVNGRVQLRTPVPGLFDEAQCIAYERAQTTFYEERRAELEREVLERWAKTLPVLPLWFTDRTVFVAKDLDGPRLGQADSIYWNVEQWRVR